MFTPVYLYYCSGGEWNFFNIDAINPNAVYTLPWPDCAGKHIICRVMRLRSCWFVFGELENKKLKIKI